MLISFSILLVGLVNCAVVGILWWVIKRVWQWRSPETWDVVSRSSINVLVMALSLGIILVICGFVGVSVGSVEWVYNRLLAAGF